ncbi:hypothetical protein P9112_011992 [Eukaryota sp. TZLM1-RC]
MKLSELIALTKDLYETFDPKKVLCDTHTQQFINLHQLDDESVVLFIYEVFSGIIRYKKVVEPIVSSFYSHTPTALRTDKSVYDILTYLSIFRYSEFDFDDFIQLFSILDSYRTHTFCSFLFNPKRIETEFRSHWNTVFDSDYVSTNLVVPLLTACSELELFLQEIDNNATFKPFVPSKSNKTTKPMEFSLSKGRPRPPPEREAISTEFRASKIPKSTYKFDPPAPTCSKQPIALNPPNLTLESRPTRKSVVLSELKAKEESENTFKPTISSSPKRKTPSIPVKLNTTTILREDLIFRKQELEEVRKVEEFEVCLHDEAQYYDEVKRRQEEEQQKEQEKREMLRLHALLSREDAKEAVQNAKLENFSTALELKNQLEELNSKAEQDRIVDQLLLKEKRNAVLACRGNARLAKDEVLQTNASEGEKRRLERERNEEEAKRRQAEEVKQKAELIAKIRAEDLIKDGYTEPFDSTTTSGSGLLCEMSLYELQERLKVVKVINKERRELKREQILGEKQQKAEILERKAQLISKIRQNKSEAAQKSRDLRRKKIEEQQRLKEEITASNSQQLLSKLEQKKKARMERESQLRKEAELIKRKNLALKAKKKKSEVVKFNDLVSAETRVEMEKTSKVLKG